MNYWPNHTRDIIRSYQKSGGAIKTGDHEKFRTLKPFGLKSTFHHFVDKILKEGDAAIDERILQKAEGIIGGKSPKRATTKKKENRFA